MDAIKIENLIDENGIKKEFDDESENISEFNIENLQKTIKKEVGSEYEVIKPELIEVKNEEKIYEELMANSEELPQTEDPDHENIYIKMEENVTPLKKEVSFDQVILATIKNKAKVPGSCSKKFEHKDELHQHLDVDEIKWPFQCEYCERKFKHNEQLIDHVLVHAGLFKCEHCKNTFTRKNNLKEHIRTHTGEKPYECKICKKKFTRKRGINGHMKVHTGEKPFECEFCKTKFTQKIRLMEHIRTHTGDKPFECEFCKKSFTRNFYLMEHIRIHTGEKPFECEFCKKGFTKKRSLTRHVQIHTSEKPFKHEIQSHAD